MSFGAPLALLALLTLLPIAGAWWYARRVASRAEAVYGGPDALRRGRSRSRIRLRSLLFVAAVALLVIAAARPQWGGTEGALTRRGIDVAIALDVSRSMSATDVAPSRAGAAAAGLDDMLSHLRGDRVGLVTFGGSAFARSPLTLDLDAVSFLINRAQGEGALVEPGTDIGKAITTAVQLLDVPDRASTQAIVVLSDGENLGQNLDAAIEAARSRDIRIYTVAVGTDDGAAVPARTPGTRQPAPAAEGGLSRADRGTLGRIAGETGGETREVQNIAGLAVEFARLQQTSFDEDSERIPVERFQWFLGAALLLLLVQWMIAEGRRTDATLSLRRPGQRTALAVLGSLAAATLLTGCGGTAAYRKVADGNAAYEAGRFEEALAAYEAAKELAPEDPTVDYNIGNTLNRLQRYDEASNASRASARLADRTGDSPTSTRALYAAGNHAFQKEALEEARDAYIDVLLRDPDDADAKHNLELVLRILEPPSEQTPPPGSTPTPTAPGSPSATATSGPNGQPSGSPTPGPGQPGATATPGAQATPAAPGTPGQPAEPGQGAESLSDQLDDLLADGVSLEEALAFLDRLRQQSDEANLAPRGTSRGGLADR